VQEDRRDAAETDEDGGGRNKGYRLEVKG
jgi:hypothetical protein